MAELPSTSDQNFLLTPDQTAHLLGVSLSTLKRMRLRGEGPHALKITGRTVRYQASDVDTWLQEKAAQMEAGRGVRHG